MQDFFWKMKLRFDAVFLEGLGDTSTHGCGELGAKFVSFLPFEIIELSGEVIADNGLALSFVYTLLPQFSVADHGAAEGVCDAACGIGVAKDLAQEHFAGFDGTALAVSCDAAASKRLVGRGRFAVEFCEGNAAAAVGCVFSGVEIVGALFSTFDEGAQIEGLGHGRNVVKNEV